MYVCVHASKSTYTYSHICMYIYICMCIYIYVHIYMCKHTYVLTVPSCCVIGEFEQNALQTSPKPGPATLHPIEPMSAGLLLRALHNLAPHRRARRTVRSGRASLYNESSCTG